MWLGRGPAQPRSRPIRSFRRRRHPKDPSGRIVRQQPQRAARAVLDFPEIAARGIDRQPLFVAMAVAPYLRLGAIAPDKGIIRRRRAIWRDPDQLAEMIAEILRLVAIAEMFAQRDEQIAVVGLHDAAAVMIA